MVRWTVEADRKTFDDVERRLGNLQKRAPAVMADAANRAATTINSEIKKELRKVYIIKLAIFKAH
ncbi:hypothetical protein JCM19037_4592 [Geomicrobium sp. JCM 19037]|uniref:hypothetical protein n=1 Tax=Geomicrobium sp. JCM 19037 TaxID=1460634 RepID=UPI00045F465C|nr:hypothetical protein [Geomicrobium sp. JCM 19037]GAK06038.1 hypothetical protein JCM19037_4592 [Geomicrobium sp. JCM 19037]